MIKNETRLLVWILIGAISGMACGWFFGESMTAVGWIGGMFLDLLKMLILPLIIAAVITGVNSLGSAHRVGKIGGLTVLYYSCTTGIAVLVGLGLVNLLQPGAGLEQSAIAVAEAEQREPSSVVDIITQLVTPNLVDAAAQTQLLPLIVFALLFGIALGTIGEKGKPILSFFDSLNEVMMKLVIWIMHLAPIGIFALIANRIGQAGGGEGFYRELQAVGMYCVTVILGLGIHFCILVGIMLLMSKQGMAYLLSMLRALLTAFGTASSSATLPMTMECALEGGADPKAVKFVLPLGVTLNMDGTALYEAVAVMFIAQALQIPLGVTEQFIIFITATLAAVGAAGIPQAGLVTMLIVLSAVNLPAEGIGLLLAVDWFLDRFRTTVNVWGDSVGAVVISRFTRNQ
ncbi:MAG: dicarboxylate/amino acid:cation symporter [Candidatus Eutrophobiaceae bacterium]